MKYLSSLIFVSFWKKGNIKKQILQKSTFLGYPILLAIIQGVYQKDETKGYLNSVFNIALYFLQHNTKRQPKIAAIHTHKFKIREIRGLNKYIINLCYHHSLTYQWLLNTLYLFITLNSIHTTSKLQALVKLNKSLSKDNKFIVLLWELSDITPQNL